MWRRCSESKVSKRGAAKLPVLFESVSTGSFVPERGAKRRHRMTAHAVQLKELRAVLSAVILYWRMPRSA